MVVVGRTVGVERGVEQVALTYRLMGDYYPAYHQLMISAQPNLTRSYRRPKCSSFNDDDVNRSSKLGSMYIQVYPPGLCGLGLEDVSTQLLKEIAPHLEAAGGKEPAMYRGPRVSPTL